MTYSRKFRKLEIITPGPALLRTSHFPRTRGSQTTCPRLRNLRCKHSCAASEKNKSDSSRRVSVSIQKKTFQHCNQAQGQPRSQQLPFPHPAASNPAIPRSNSTGAPIPLEQERFSPPPPAPRPLPTSRTGPRGCRRSPGPVTPRPSTR